MRARIAMAAIAGVAIAMVAVTFGLVRYVRVSLERQLDDRLSADAEQVLAVMPAIVDMGLEDRSVPSDPTGRIVQVVDGEGTVLGGRVYANDRDKIPVLAAPFPWEAGTLPRTFSTTVDGLGALRAQVTMIAAENPRYLVIARPRSSIDNSVRTLTRALSIGLPLVIALLGWMIWIVVGRVLRPVDALRRSVDSISAHDLTRRVEVHDRRDEIDLLAETMNGMLSRLQAAADRERQLIADASHELRSPLAAVRALVETRHQAEADAAAEHDAHTVVAITRLQALIDELLDLSRYDAISSEIDATPTAPGGAPSSRRLVDLDDIVLEQAALLRHTTNLNIDTIRVSGGQVTGSHDSLQRMMANLCSNAARHAASTVRFVVEETDDAVQLQVIDDGTGIPVADRRRVFERFTRLTEARERDEGGAGLGLAIVERIVAHHGGTIDITDPGEGAGTMFVIRFPLPR